MTWWIIFNIGFYCGFAVVAHLALIPYSISISLFLNVWPRNSFPPFYIIIVEQGYLHNHVCSSRFAIVAAFLLLYDTISNHPVAGYIINKDFSMRGFSWPSLLILYWPIRSTNNMSHGMASASLAGNFPYLRFYFLFLWQVLHTFMWVRIFSLNWGQD